MGFQLFFCKDLSPSQITLDIKILLLIQFEKLSNGLMQNRSNSWGKRPYAIGRYVVSLSGLAVHKCVDPSAWPGTAWKPGRAHWEELGHLLLHLILFFLPDSDSDFADIMASAIFW